MFKLKLTKAEWDALSEGQRAFYVADGDAYKLPLPDEDDPATLRRANTEINQKAKERKAKVETLESTVADLEAKLVERETSIRALTIDGPVREMCKSLSTAPELFEEILLKHFTVQLIEGKLTLIQDGKPVVDKQGKLIPWEWGPLSKILTEGNDARAKAFKAITIVSKASGGGNVAPRRATETKPQIKFGLR